MIGYIAFSYDRSSLFRRVSVYDSATARNTVIDDSSLRESVVKELNSRSGIKILSIYEEAISDVSKSIVVWYEKP